MPWRPSWPDAAALGVPGRTDSLRDIKNILAFQKVVVLRLPTETFAVHNSEL